MTTQGLDAILSKLTGTGITAKNAVDDMRGRKVTGKDRAVVGKVRDVFVDDRERKARFLLVEHGGFFGIGKKTYFIPVDAIRATTSDVVLINDTRDHVAEGPIYDPDVANDRSYQSHVYDHYGYTPYWSAGYAYPGFNF